MAPGDPSDPEGEGPGAGLGVGLGVGAGTGTNHHLLRGMWASQIIVGGTIGNVLDFRDDCDVFGQNI